MNQPPKGIQDLVYALDGSAFKHAIRWILAGFCVVAIAGLYLFTEARNFSNPEAMDMAQLGRNIAMGRGYTTHMIRPLSFRLYRDRTAERELSVAGLLQSPHPDLHNPPVYPMMLAGLFKVAPESFRSSLPVDVRLSRPKPELLITGFNLFWFAMGAWMIYRLGKRLFDPGVGWLAAALYAGTELMWRFSSNGLTTPFLLVLVLVIAELLTRLDELGVELAPGVVPPLLKPLGLAALLGVVLGIGFLTRYAFGWLIVPAVLWILICHVRRWGSAAACVLAFLLVITPWLLRNHHLSGRLLGSAYTSLTSETLTFPESWLERHLKEPKNLPDLTEIRVKLAVSGSELLRTGVPVLGGNWIVFFFFAGVVLPFRTPQLRRLRWFSLGSLVLLFFVESLGRTHWGTLVPVINGENQMVLMAPIMFIFGTSLFFTLIESTEFGHPIFQRLFIGGAWVVMSLPLLTAVLPPRTYPLAEPNYRPDIVKEFSGYIEPSELMMSDVPWSVAWYGDRDCIWLPLLVRDGKGEEDFYAINDFERRVAALYLSPFTTEASLRQIGTGAFVWGRFYFDALLRGNLPKGFPLVYAYEGSVRDGHLFLADRKRW
jgi:hypothetical protein